MFVSPKNFSLNIATYFILMVVFFLAGCKTNSEYRRESDARQIEGLTKKLFHDAIALQRVEEIKTTDLPKINMIDTAPDVKLLQKNVSNLEKSYAESMRETLNKLKRFPWKHVERAIHSFSISQERHGELEDPLREILLKYAKRSRFGMKFQSDDIVQDIQSLSLALPQQ
jgi:hypothetical protein